MDSNENESSINMMKGVEDETLKGYAKNWRKDFIKLGGLDHLHKFFDKLTK